MSGGPREQAWTRAPYAHVCVDSLPRRAQWPAEEQLQQPAPGVVQIGIAIEPLQALLEKEGSKLGARADFAKRVGMDLFR